MDTFLPKVILMSIQDSWSKYRDVLFRADTIYTKLKQSYREPPLHLVALPIAYRFVSEKQLPIPKEAMILTGQFLRQRYPELHDEFTTRNHEKMLKEVREVMMDFMEHKDEK